VAYQFSRKRFKLSKLYVAQMCGRGTETVITLHPPDNNGR